MAEISAYTGKYNQFTRQILQKFYVAKKDQNLVLSPFSILMLLAIAADATDGDTRTEILNVLSDDLDYDDCINLFCKLQSVLTEGHALSSANAVCVQHAIEDTITPDYPAFLQAQFRGQLFCTSNIVEAVNKWVKENTHGLIDKAADDSMKNMLACLMNATAFEGKWTKHYTRNDIEYKDFTSSDGSVRDVAMIEDTEREYVESESFTGFVKPYKNIDYSFMALLPKKKSASSLKTALGKLDFSELFEGRTEERVVISLPEFKNSFGEDLTSYCKSLGINKIFSDHADFSPLSSAWLKMDSIIHKARIEVDRNGTKAVAVTMGLVCAGCAPRFDFKIVELNRPFVYAIMHNGTGLPVFAGIVNKL